jgi:uncharacterized protein (DUF305 family)
MQKVPLYLVVSLMCIAGFVGVGVGYYLTPEYQLSMYDKNSMDLGIADRWLDLRYINAMIAHHRGAVLLAEQAQVSEREEVRALAREILASEPALIAELYAWKKDWYRDTRTVRDPLVPKLGSYDSTFDLRFLNALIAHHQAGVLMTKDVRVKTSRAEVQGNADAVEQFLTTSTAMLMEWRKSWYNL